MTQVRIPPVLRESASGNKQVELEGASVGEVLDRLTERFPGLRAQLFSEQGKLNRFVNVYLNDEDVRYLSELDTPVSERDTIVVLPAMAGGAPRQCWGGRAAARMRRRSGGRAALRRRSGGQAALRRRSEREARRLSDSNGHGLGRRSSRSLAHEPLDPLVPEHERAPRGPISGSRSPRAVD